MTTKTLDETLGDVFDIRDIIPRFEELEAERAALVDAADEATQDGGTAEADAKRALDEWDESDDGEEFRKLSEFLGEVRGNGGDEQWHGDWYPVTFIRDSYFERYAEELAEELGMIPDGAKWPANCIDWEQAARELQMDYSSVELDGDTYWYH